MDIDENLTEQRVQIHIDFYPVEQLVKGTRTWRTTQWEDEEVNVSPAGSPKKEGQHGPWCLFRDDSV